MHVYLVTRYEYPDSEVVGVYSTRGKARGAIKRWKGRDAEDDQPITYVVRAYTLDWTSEA